MAAERSEHVVVDSVLQDVHGLVPLHLVLLEALIEVGLAFFSSDIGAGSPST